VTDGPVRGGHLGDLVGAIVTCRACPRLVEWREQVAEVRVARFADRVYWGRPVPGVGDPDASILMVGLAPAAHGANRTGRMFTGDRSGDFLFAALHRAGLANRPTSTHASDGLRLTGVYLAAVNRCAPPANSPTPEERDRCLPYLRRELELLSSVRTIVCLGAWGWDGALRALSAIGPRPTRRPVFGHGAEAELGRYTLLGCFHPSQQNTFTGRLTPRMIDAVLQRALGLAASSVDRSTIPDRGRL
jgi:uracil-DNA glycosylase family 4